MARCTVGKRCGATCIQRDKKCELDLVDKFSSALARVAQRLYQSEHGNLLDTPEKAINWIESNTSRLLIGGFENSNYVNAMGQSGRLRAPVWFIGLEGGNSGENLLFGSKQGSDLMGRYKKLGLSPGVEKEGRNENKLLDANRLAYINSLRDHAAMQTATFNKARQMGFQIEDLNFPEVANILRKPGVTVEEIKKKTESIDKGITTDMLKNQNSNGASYVQKAAKLVDKMNENEVAMFNISNLERPGTSSFPVRDFLKENNVNVKTFAGGVYKNDSSWYAASAAVKSRKIVDSVMEYKPKLIYIAGQVRNGPQGELFRQMLNRTGVVPKSVTVLSKNSKGDPVNTTVQYGIITHPNGQRTVVANGMHLTGTTGSWPETEKFLLNAVN